MIYSKKAIFFLMGTAYSVNIFSQNDTSYKNKISFGCTLQSEFDFPEFFYFVSWKRSLKNFEIVNSVSYNNYKYTYDSGTSYNAAEICYNAGVIKTVSISQNKKWDTFYGAEIFCLYNEIKTDHSNRYFTIPGIDLTVGMQYNLRHHFSLSSQISPAIGYVYFNAFEKIQPPGPGVEREEETGHLKNLDLFFIRFASIEINYNF